MMTANQYDYLLTLSDHHLYFYDGSLKGDNNLHKKILSSYKFYYCAILISSLLNLHFIAASKNPSRSILCSLQLGPGYNTMRCCHRGMQCLRFFYLSCLFNSGIIYSQLLVQSKNSVYGCIMCLTR